jgi:Mn2+/Fe2+ NRAMP family transporter
MMLIINNKEVMGVHTNKRLGNIIGWATITVLVCLSAVLLITSIF